MKALHLLAVSAAMSALLIPAASKADAQGRPAGQGPRNNFPSHGGGMHGINNGFFVVEREVPIIIEREVVREAPPLSPSPQGEGKSDPPRKPYVIGSTYASLPAGCMKMIEEGAAYYYCDGEWYREVRDGRSATYKAVQQEL